MKRHSIRSARSRSKHASINKLIHGRTKIDELYYGKYLPLRETKLLEQIIRTRAAYGNVQSEQTSGSRTSEHTQSGNELRLRGEHDTKNNSAAVKTIGLVDRFNFGSSSACKSSCCSTCSCSSSTLKTVVNHVERRRPPYGHHVPSENITKLTVESEKKDRRRRRGLSTKISSKFRNISYKVKRIQSEPLSSIATRPSKVYINRSRTKMTTTENGKIEKDDKKYPQGTKIYASKIAKKTKNTRHSATKDIEKQKPFEIKKDSLSLFREKLKNEHPSHQCETGTCLEDNCLPEKCFYKSNRRNSMDTKGNKYYSRHYGPRRSHISVTKRLRNPNTRKSHDQVTNTCIPRQKSFSSMTTLSVRNSYTSTDHVRIEPKKVGPKYPKHKPLTQIESEKTLTSEYLPRKRTASVIYYNRGQEYKTTRNNPSRSLTKMRDSHTLQSIPKTEIPKVKRRVTRRSRAQLAVIKSEEKACETDHPDKKRMQSQTENKSESTSSSAGINDQIAKYRQKSKASPARGSLTRELEKEKRIYTIDQQKPMINFKSRKVETFKVPRKSTSSMTKAKPMKPLKQDKRYKILYHTVRTEPEEKSSSKHKYTSGREKIAKNNQTTRTQVKSKTSQAPLLPITNQSRHRKNGYDFANYAELLYKSKQESPINVGTYLNVDNVHSHRRPVRNVSNSGFYKNKSSMEGGDQVHSKHKMKQKGVQLERKQHDHGMQYISLSIRNTASQSRSSKFKNKQVGNSRLKQYLCSLKLFQQKRQKKIQVASKKSIASINTEKLKKGGHIKQTQTKQLGIALVSPPLTSIRGPQEPCEPFFCTPGECNPHDCAERRKLRNHTARRSKVTNTVPISKRSSAVTTRPLSKSISRKIQSDENRHRKEKGNNFNPLKIKPRALTSKSVRPAVRIGSNFMSNIDLFKRNRNQKKEKPYKLKSDNTTKKENKQYQQPGIKVFKAHAHNEILETKAGGPIHTDTEPFLKKWLCTLGVRKNDKDCIETSRPFRSKNAPYVMQLQNKLFTANRADVLYNYARPKDSLEYRSITCASSVNVNLKTNCQRMHENSNTVDRKAISDKPNTSSKQYNQNKDIKEHSDRKTNFLNQCYLPVQTGSKLNINNDLPKHHSLASKAKKVVHQKPIDVTPIQQNKGTHSYVSSVVKRFFSFNLKKKHQQLEYQNNIIQKNTQVSYLSSHKHVNQNATKKLNKPKVYNKHHVGDYKNCIPEAEMSNPCGYYDGIQQQQITRPFDNYVRTDRPNKKSVTNNLKSKSTQSKIFKKYAKIIPHRNGRSANPRSSLCLAVPIRSNVDVDLSRNRTARVIQDPKSKATLNGQILKHQWSQKIKREDGVSTGGSLLKRCKPILEQKNTDSKLNNMATKLNLKELQSSWKKPQNCSKSDYDSICGQNGVKNANYDSKRIQNNYNLAKSRQFRSRTDFNVREYQIGYCFNTQKNNPFNPSYTPNVRRSNLKNVPLQRSKFYYADTLESNLAGHYKLKSDEMGDVLYSKTQNNHVGKGKNRPISIKPHVNTRMGVNNDVDRHRNHEIHNQTFLSKYFRSLFKKEKYNVNESVLKTNHPANPSRKAHFGSDLLIDAKFLKQANHGDYFARNDKTQRLINNRHIRNTRSQVHYRTQSRATGLTKLLRRCFRTANMQYEVRNQIESQKVINNLNHNSLIVKNAKTIRQLKQRDSATRRNIYNIITKDEYSKDNFKERKCQSTRTYRQIYRNSQTIGINYPKYNATSNLSERNRTFQPNIKYKSREWLPYPNYCVLRCENTQNTRFVKFGTKFGMSIDYPRNNYNSTSPGTTVDKCNQLQIGDGYGSAVRDRSCKDEAEMSCPGRASKKSQIEVDCIDKSIGECQVDSKNTQFKRKRNTRSKSITTSHGTCTQQQNINRTSPKIILEDKGGGILKVTQTDKELETIMPYSKKKFNKQESKTKLSHHSTNTARLKEQKRYENVMINKNGEYLVYHQQNVTCNRVCKYSKNPKGSEKKSPEDNIVADRNATRDNTVANRNATQDDNDETPKRGWRTSKRKPKEQNETNEPLSENVNQKDNIIVIIGKDNEREPRERSESAGKWTLQKDRPKQSDAEARRKAKQQRKENMAKRIPDDDDDDDDDDSEERSRFERIKRAFKRKLRDKGDTDKSLSENVPPKGNITVADKEEERPRSDRYTPLGIWKRRNDKKEVQEQPRERDKIVIIHPHATQDDVAKYRESTKDNIDESRIELIRRALRRRTREHAQPQAAPEPEPAKPLFELMIQKNNMSILNPQEVLPMLNKGPVQRGTASAPPSRTQGTPKAPATQPEQGYDYRIELIKKILGIQSKITDKQKPAFEMVVNKNKMVVMNKDEVFPVLDSPEKRSKRQKEDPSNPPAMELHVDRTTASIVNADEIINKLKVERQRQMMIKHKGGPVSYSEGEALLKLHGKSCNCCFCRKYKEQNKTRKKKKVVKPRRLKPCVCGSDVCLKDWSRLKEEQSDLDKVQDIPPCVCGTEVCKREFENLPKKRLQALRRQRQKEIDEKKQKIYHQARRRRRRKYRAADLKRIKKREDMDKREMSKIKNIKAASPVVMAVESARDIGAFGFRCLGSTLRSFSRTICHPKDAVYNAYDTARAIKRKPATVIKKKIQQDYKESGLKSTVARVKQRAVQTTLGRTIKTRMQANPITNYLVHITNPDPKVRMDTIKRKKRRKRKRDQEPVDFECSLYMNTLRRRPFLRIYYMCPWFYPHCVNLFGLWKQLANVLMFLLAVCVWSPCILCFEACRAMACCCMCTGYDM